MTSETNMTSKLRRPEKLKTTQKLQYGCIRGGVIIKKQENLGQCPKQGGGDQKKTKNVSNSNSDI